MKQARLNHCVQNYIIRSIFDGKYPHGSRLPSLRSLAELCNTDSKSVRTTLKILVKDGVIQEKKFGRYHVDNSGLKMNSTMDTVAFVAPAQRRFFSIFIDHFQQIADRFHSLVAFVQRSEEEPIEETLLRLYQNGVRNAVIWLDYETINNRSVKQLHAMGMKLVFFDI
jgi:DNA-binding transcriptional MocR family regulator